ncbi:MAG: putative lipid II flippase FtsW [Acidobacteria bacterium]|nr:putative lipid II flippase FtsW [Acidobacteriota bacterium]
MARRLESDRILFGTVVVLVLFGALMVFSASAVMAEQRFGSSYYFLVRQLIWALLGFSLMLAAMHFDYRRLAQPTIIFPVLGLQFLLLVAVLFADRTKNAHRWLHVGPVGIQPSEFSKLVLAMFLAYFLSQRKVSIDDMRHTLLPIGLISGACVALILKEPDLGTSMALVLIVAAMLYAAGLRWVYFACGLAAAIPLLYVAIFFVGYRQRRILAFLDPYADPLGKGFQIIQSFIAVGAGGIDGVGLMDGKQKLFFLPEPHTDFIFAVIGEELGFVGGLFVLALFALILWRGLRASARSTDEFGRLLAVGLTVMIVGQALVNISVVLGLMPTKGIPLPLISYGGSSLMVNLAAVGVLLNISQHSS